MWCILGLKFRFIDEYRPMFVDILICSVQTSTHMVESAYVWNGSCSGFSMSLPTRIKEFWLLGDFVRHLFTNSKPNAKTANEKQNQETRHAIKTTKKKNNSLGPHMYPYMHERLAIYHTQDKCTFISFIIKTNKKIRIFEDNYNMINAQWPTSVSKVLLSESYLSIRHLAG